MDRLPLVDADSVRQLRLPHSDSYKGRNGVLTVIGGSHKYHGAPLLALLAASRFVDLVYFYSPEKENVKLLAKLKAATRTFIGISAEELKATIKRSDAVLIGNGMTVDADSKRLVNGLLKAWPEKRFVLDAAALRVVDPARLGPNCLLTPHANEFYALFGTPISPSTVESMAREMHCVILAKGKFDLISDGRRTYRNLTGNEGMTKGGTGDVLAGLAAAFYCKSDALVSACAAAYLNGLAGDRLKKKVGIAFNADDLVAEIPHAFRHALG